MLLYTSRAHQNTNPFQFREEAKRVYDGTLRIFEITMLWAIP